MTAKSPTSSVRSREIIGVHQFSQRREVFDKYDTVFLPSPPLSPTTAMAAHDVQPILTSNHGKTTANFKRNAPNYSSMRESRTEDRNIEFRTRKYSDNFTSELNQSDEVDYRRSMTERTRRLSKLRRDFLNSNLHEPGHDSSFTRIGARATMPTNSASILKYKIESPNLYKFPFAEPYATPPSIRRVVVDLGPAEVNGEKENLDPSAKTKHQSLPTQDSITPKKIDHQKLFEELVKRYSPERKPIDWKLPPTRPRVVGSVPKSTSSVADNLDGSDKKKLDEVLKNPEDDEVFIQKEMVKKETDKVENESNKNDENEHEKAVKQENLEITGNGPAVLGKENDAKIGGKLENYSKSSSTELDEQNDEVPELSIMAKLNRDMPKRPSLDKYTDITIPALIEKITEEGEDLENHKKEKKVKRKRSFLDKLLGRKKEIK